MVHTYNPISEKEGRDWQIPEAHCIDNLACLVNRRPVRDFCLKNQDGRHQMLSAGLHTHMSNTCRCTCTYMNTNT